MSRQWPPASNMAWFGRRPTPPLNFAKYASQSRSAYFDLAPPAAPKVPFVPLVPFMAKEPLTMPAPPTSPGTTKPPGDGEPGITACGDGAKDGLGAGPSATKAALACRRLPVLVCRSAMGAGPGAIGMDALGAGAGADGGAPSGAGAGAGAAWRAAVSASASAERIHADGAGTRAHGASADEDGQPSACKCRLCRGRTGAESILRSIATGRDPRFAIAGRFRRARARRRRRHGQRLLRHERHQRHERHLRRGGGRQVEICGPRLGGVLGEVEGRGGPSPEPGHVGGRRPLPGHLDRRHAGG
mmetsp:Transcript_35424/g.102020  ORF Transcript_35424/g.102020 Transcript_35424/m.102020 type:complete len:301 (+) Transcript_35424:570-1472(+)